MGASTGVSELLLDVDRVGGNPGRDPRRRHPSRRGAEHDAEGDRVSALNHAGREGGSRLRGADGSGDAPLPRMRRFRAQAARHGRAGSYRDAGLSGGRSLRGGESSDRDPERSRRVRQTRRNRIGLGIVGAGRVGLIRGEIAARFPEVDFIGIAEPRADRAKFVAEKVSAAFVTSDSQELFARPEIPAAIIATDEHLHVEPILAAAERGLALLIEKPLATELADSARVLRALQSRRIDAVVGYTQRFRQRWLAAKEKVRTGALGEVTMATSRGFMNRLVAIDNYQRTSNPESISPMVISGTHALDLLLWILEGKRPVEVYARSVDKVLGPRYGGIDGTAGLVTFDDGSLLHLSISWALPVVWPGAVYSLEVGIVGTEGVLTIDDTHRDIVLAVSKPQQEGYNPDASRLVDFMGSYPPGDMALGELRGPMADETVSWLNRVALGLPTQHATAAEAHNRLMLTKALDLSGKRTAP